MPFPAIVAKDQVSATPQVGMLSCREDQSPLAVMVLHDLCSKQVSPRFRRYAKTFILVLRWE